MAEQQPVPESERDPDKRYTPDGLEVPAPSENDVLYEPDDGFAWITLNRPLVLNAVDWSLLRGLGRALDSAETDSDVRAIVLRGAGRAFCAGGDLQSSPRPDDGVETPGTGELMQRIWTSPKPVIAAVRGHAVGQGAEIAGMCDMTIAADDAKFGEIQIRHGFGPPILISPFLTGLKQAKELMMLGEIYEADEALRLGLVNRVVPADRLDEEAAAWAKKIASLPRQAVALNKALVNRVYELAGFQAALDYRDDEAIRALSDRNTSDAEGTQRIGVLRGQGWEEFKRQRDAAYGEQ
jgi:enoyl-CoA hydratase/carnithine racemase